MRQTLRRSSRPWRLTLREVLAPDHQSADGCGCRLMRLESSPSFRRHSSSFMTACLLPWSSTSLSGPSISTCLYPGRSLLPRRWPRSCAGHDVSWAVFWSVAAFPLAATLAHVNAGADVRKSHALLIHGPLQRWDSLPIASVAGARSARPYS